MSFKTFNEEWQTNRILNTVDKIEDRLNKMMHEIPELAEDIKYWQDGKIKNVTFMEILNKYLDSKNKG